jgi:hypothetical protein
MSTAYVLLLVIVALLLAGCSGEQAADIEEYNQNYTNEYIQRDNVTSRTENLAGHVTIYGNTLYLDEARVIIYDSLYPHHSFFRHAGENIVVIAYGDTEKLNELGSEVNGDWLEIWPNGFSVEPLGKETLSFELKNDTTFTFVDTGFLFLDDSYMNRTYHTTVVDEFLLHRGDSNTILFVQVQNGRVISVVEELLFTQ